MLVLGSISRNRRQGVTKPAGLGERVPTSFSPLLPSPASTQTMTPNMLLTRPILLPFTLYTLFNLTTMLLEVPAVRLFEHAICVQTFQRSDIREAECKTAGVQDMLSFIIGWKLTLDACAGMQSHI